MKWPPENIERVIGWFDEAAVAANDVLHRLMKAGPLLFPSWSEEFGHPDRLTCGRGSPKYRVTYRYTGPRLAEIGGEGLNGGPHSPPVAQDAPFGAFCVVGQKKIRDPIHPRCSFRSRFIGDPAAAGQVASRQWAVPHHRSVGLSPMNRLPHVLCSPVNRLPQKQKRLPQNTQTKTPALGRRFCNEQNSLVGETGFEPATSTSRT